MGIKVLTKETRDVQLDAQAITELYKYVREHLHVLDVKFSGPFNDPSAIVEERDCRNSRKIASYLQINQGMYQVSRVLSRGDCLTGSSSYAGKRATSSVQEEG